MSRGVQQADKQLWLFVSSNCGLSSSLSSSSSGKAGKLVSTGVAACCSNWEKPASSIVVCRSTVSAVGADRLGKANTDDVAVLLVLVPELSSGSRVGKSRLAAASSTAEDSPSEALLEVTDAVSGGVAV